MPLSILISSQKNRRFQIFKNTASQKIQFWAYLSTTVKPQTGDAANITAYVSIDGGAVTVLADTSATELSATNAPGCYQFDLATGETNGDSLLFTAKSGTANVVLYPRRIDTTAPASNALTLAAIATQIWQDATAGDFTAANSIGKSLYNGGHVPGTALGGVICGTNAATAFASLGVTNDFLVGGNVTISGDFLVDDFTVGGLLTLTSFLTAGNFQIIGNLEVDGTTLLIGSVTANNAGNDIQGIALQNLSISSSTFFTDAIDANAVATSAAAKIGQAVWDVLTTALTTVGSIGKAIVTYITGLGGAFDLTITVKDNNGVALQNVRFNVFDGTNQLIASGFTDASGQSTDSYPAGTFTVALVKANYLFAALTRTVTGAQTGTLKNNLVMTVITLILPPADPTLQTIFGRLFGPNGALVNGVIEFSLSPADPARPLTVNGNVSTFETATAITDALGNFTIDLPQTILFDDDVFFHIVCKPAQIDIDGVALGVAPLDIATL